MEVVEVLLQGSPLVACAAVQKPAHEDESTAHSGPWLHLGAGLGLGHHPSGPPQGRSAAPPALWEPWQGSA